MSTRAVAACALAAAVMLPGPGLASAGERFALVVSGASGGEPYAAQYDKWRQALVTSLLDRLALRPDRLFVLAERDGDGAKRATRENVQVALGEVRRRMMRDDQLLVALIGHGTFDGAVAKFNLVGPDLDAAEWAALLKPLPGRVVFVDTTGASFPFLAEISARGRVVVTATDSVAQRYETVFPEFFVNALDDLAADLDKNGRVSVLEAFGYASTGVRRWFEERGQLATERPLLDDNGDGIGREAGLPGPDGALARATYLDPDVPAALAGDSSLGALLKRRAALEAEIEALKEKKGSMPPDQYEAELEKLLVELARVSRQIRVKS